MLSDSDSEAHELQLTINEHYAKAYSAKKEREELSKLKEKYGTNAEEDESEEDSEDDESEDEDGEELTPAVDAAILRTLARIKRKDPDIYDKGKSIFEQEQERIGRTAPRAKLFVKSNTKPLTIKQHALSSVLNTSLHSPEPEPQVATHDQEQNALRSEAISAFHEAVNGDGGEGEDDSLLVLREKTKDEVEREEEEYQEFLRREVGEDINGLVTVDDDHGALLPESGAEDEEDEEDEEKTMLKKKKKKKKSNKGKEKERPETDQEFLMNYILNRGWIDRSSRRVPTYNEITHNREHGRTPIEQTNAEVDQQPLLDEENDFEEIADRFETSYNFRFEEPDAAVIPTHPRNLPGVVRRQDTTRKEARERRKQRKEEELLKKKEEVRRLKALKMKELRQKLERIGKEGGVDIDPEAFVGFDLDGDWDPEKHDRQMAGLYNGEGHEDDEKPHWSDEIDVDDVLPSAVAGPVESKSKKKIKKKQKAEQAGPDGVDTDAMDADVSKLPDEEEWDGTEEMRKRKAQEYMDEIHGMDFNDVVADIPTRFKYNQVASHSFALTPAEILLASDAELNEYIGIKRFAPYRKDSRWDVKRADRLKDLKSKLKERGWNSGEADADSVETKTKKRKGKKERQRAKATEVGEDEKTEKDEKVEITSEPPEKKRRKG